MATLAIRVAELKDADALTRLINRAFVAESPYIAGERINVDGVRDLIARGTFLIGEVGGTLLAGVFVERRGESAHLGLVSVDPDCQGEGFGLQIMNAAEAHCRRAGYAEMELRFIDHRAELQKFYERCGFAATGRVEAPDPGRAKIPFHFVQMAKRLE
jgi:GNAT superfamily N-acetyltransferase